IRLYIDGAFDSESDYTVVDLDSGTDSYQIGARESDNFWQGDIDEVSFYNRVLIASEIQALFDARNAGKCAGDILVPGDGESIVTPDTGLFRLAGRVTTTRGLATLQFKGKRLDLGTEVAEMVTFSGSLPNYSFDTIVCCIAPEWNLVTVRAVDS